ncbi:MAG: Card1-like endonuclease domain-containing protein [Ottowia sp.]
MKTQICLVSDQAAANILPALDSQLKPDRVILVVSAAMSKKAEYLENVLRENSIRQIEQIKLKNEADFQKTEEELLELAEKLSGEDVVLNITGGTKLMALAAQSIAHASDWRIFYLDANTDTITWLHKHGGPQQQPQPLQNYLRLPHYLKTYGFTLNKKPDRTSPTPAQKRASDSIIQFAANLENAITMLNALAQDAENRNILRVPVPQRSPYSFNALIDYFSDAQALSMKNGNIVFSSVQDRDFVKGGWLELYTIDTIHQLSGPLKIRDKAIGLEVIENSSQTKNELDIAFLLNNRLHVIECKTARIDKPQGGGKNPAPPKANDALYKLQSNCRRIGGLATRGMLVSYRNLGPSEMRLADALNIKVVASQRLARLKDEIIQWTKGHR